MTGSVPQAADGLKAAVGIETVVTESGRRKVQHLRAIIVIATSALVVIGAAVGFAVTSQSAPAYPIHRTQYVRYLGVHEPDAPASYSGIDRFAQSVGRQPNIVSYYGPWLEPFQVGFATAAAKRGAITVVQIDPQDISLASIANGRYDAYLRSYATAIRAFGQRVVLSFGHEMNGNWSSWGNQHTSPAVFVAAWRHIVDVFRADGANNVIWLWTVNVVSSNPSIPNPTPWWPGTSYVTWVGLDGYYYLQSSSFAAVFGPTISDLRQLTGDPIFIAETGAVPAADQAAKINDLFTGIRNYGLLGFMWFDENAQGRAWQINSPGAYAEFRRDAKAFMIPKTKQASAAQH